MKISTKHVLITSVALLLTSQLFAQNIYTRIAVGYAFNNSSSELINSRVSKSSYSFTVEKHSFGKGGNTGIAIGYMFNEYIGTECGLDYLFGAKKSTNNDTVGLYNRTDLSANMFRITPGIVIQTGEDNINPYARFGFIIGVGNSIYRAVHMSDGSNSLDFLEKYNGGISTGINAAIGINFMLGYKLMFFSEISMTSISYAPTKSEIIELNYNNQNRLSDLRRSERECVYVEDINGNINDPAPSSDEPSKNLKVSYPFSSIGANIGLKISF